MSAGTPETQWQTFPAEKWKIHVQLFAFVQFCARILKQFWGEILLEGSQMQRQKVAGEAFINFASFESFVTLC